MMQDTSLISYLQISGDDLGLGERQKLVYNALLKLKTATNTMLSNYLKLPINCIVPRIFELREKKIVEMGHKGICPITNRNVIFWKISESHNAREKVDTTKKIRSINPTGKPIINEDTLEQWQ